jgi:DNA-binding transcriptional ArsR family regulator
MSDIRETPDVVSVDDLPPLRTGLDYELDPVVRADQAMHLKALADPTRRLILDELADRDGQTLFELCARLTMKHQVGSTRQAISQHIEVLEEAGLVHVRRDGRYKFHFLDSAPIAEITARWRAPSQNKEDS